MCTIKQVLDQVNRKRLYKSSDAVISGVCGGIAEYFDIDPTLVRILTVVISILGLGLPVIIYVILMIVVPPDPGVAQGYVDARAEAKEAPCQRIYATVTADQPPPPDPSTRVSAASGAAQATAGGGSPTEKNPSSFANMAKTHKTAVPLIGIILVGVGIIALLCNIVHISVWRFWPVILIVAGVVSLFTPGPRGWSLERAGNSIVLITIGLALLAWMLQLVHTSEFIAAFRDLWPALLVVAGLAIIGSARKSSVVSLSSSLVLSATIIAGILLYSGLDLANLGAAALLIEGDGLHAFFTDILPIK